METLLRASPRLNLMWDILRNSMQKNESVVNPTSNPTITDNQQVPSYRFDQLCKGIYSSPYLLSNIPKVIRQQLIKQTSLTENYEDDQKIELSITPISRTKSEQAQKILFQLKDKQKIETVFMQFKSHNSVCISSQAGCALNCSFCATGKIGFKRNLTSDEITDQRENNKIDSISFMGMGEPLMNPNIFQALEILTNEKAFNLSSRKINVSTVGIVKPMEFLTKNYPQVNLAVSLHSPFQDQRTTIMPISRTNPLDAVWAAIDHHASVTNRKVFIAYLVLQGVNNSHEHAKALASMLTEQRDPRISNLLHLNLLKYNPINLLEINKFADIPTADVKDDYQKTSKNAVEEFAQLLISYGLNKNNITFRQSFGVDIDAACGQLYGKYENKRLKIENGNKRLNIEK